MQSIAQVHAFVPTAESQVVTRFDAEYGVYWGFMRPTGRPCFTPQLLTELRGFVDGIVNREARSSGIKFDGGIKYAVIASQTPGVFSLGGDLDLFRDAIQRCDRDQLLKYGRQC